MRENLTTGVEIAGAILISVGVGMALGVAAACIIGGIFCLGFGWLAGKQ
jgi:mannose/fructose/N-acetylgalactosamine-specific phosphotransferase system component IIC